jgi:hypothetical protein
MPVERALHVELASAPTKDGSYRRNGQVWPPAQRVSFARFVAALCARALARTWSGTVHSCLIIFLASGWLIGWPSGARSW